MALTTPASTAMSLKTIWKAQRVHCVKSLETATKTSSPPLSATGACVVRMAVVL